MREFEVIDARQLHVWFRLDATTGALYWILPPKNQPRLNGRIAGYRRPGHRSKAYWFVVLNGHPVQRSYIVYCMTHGHWPKDQIDHIDGNSVNDAPDNLREATSMQNAWNLKKPHPRKLPLPVGVVKVRSGRFAARITVQKQQVWLGTFDTLEHALTTYQTARQQHFGEFA